MKEVTKTEALRLLAEIGHKASVTVKVPDGWGSHDKVTVLNDSMPYDLDGVQLGISTNEYNAERAIEQIEKNGGTFYVYSNFFSSANGGYRII